MKFLAGVILTIVIGCSAANAQVPGNLVGKWFEGSSSTMSEQNMTTGSVSSRYGSSIGYTVEADGTFRYWAD